MHAYDMATAGKRYGLILPSKKKTASTKVAKPSVFGDSSSDEEDASAARRHINVSLRRENEKRSKQTHDAVAKALEEDPSVFEYDSLYDDMTDQKKRADPRLQKRDTKPKYIHALKRTAERRKLEQDIIYERKAQREIEKEGQMYADKETFLTSAYRQKLEERKKMEEELRCEEEAEKANAVTKQKDLSQFYKHILHQQTSGTDKKKPVQKKPVPSSPPATGEENREHTRRNSKEEERRRRAVERETEEGRSRAKRSPDTAAERSRDGESPERLKRAESPDRSPESEEGGSEPGGSPRAPAEQQETKPVDPAERRKAASAKRTGDQALQSARERYLARKRARLASGD